MQGFIVAGQGPDRRVVVDLPPMKPATDNPPAGRDPAPHRPGRARRIARWTLRILALLILLIGIAAGGLWMHLRSSLPSMDGDRTVSGIAAPVTIERDRLGVPTIRAESRLDAVFALGFLHAQDRFFQMDLQRRAAAGELAALIGPAVLRADRDVRVHRFRHVAQQVVQAAEAPERDSLEAYAAGVNAGLDDLGADPFEYLLLRAASQRWLPEDSLLVLFAMYLTLHDDRGRRESNLGVLYDTLPRELADFLAPRGTEWDAPLIGAPLSAPPVPGPDIVDLRPAGSTVPEAGDEPRAPAGSNNWAVDGSRTSDGRAILAGDMHLGLSVPNIWYRASLIWTDRNGSDHRVTGVTLSGVPAIVAGSNGKVAWTFTNSQGDWGDLIVLEIDPQDADRYLTPDGYRAFVRHTETIHVKGGADETLEVLSTIWGPVRDRDRLDRPRAFRWTAYDVGGVNLLHARMETARDLEEAMDRAQLVGSPPQNVLIADSSGRIGWTILGRIPRRIGFPGRRPTSWADGSRRWDGWLAPEDYPVVTDPPSGQLWTANARTVHGEWLALLGDGGYALGARARQIRDALLALNQVDEAELLAIQLDDRALFLERWRDLLLELLTRSAVAADPRREELRALVEAWGGRAAVDSAGFRMVRTFRRHALEDLLVPLTAACSEADDRFRIWDLLQSEAPLWQLVQQRPAHLVPPGSATWDEALMRSVDRLTDRFSQEGSALADHTWGERNTVRIRHPLSLAVPALGRWLDMPAEPLPGDSHMPRVQSPGFGASQRMVVSPGHEEDGFFHMPGGQSGHPMSPHYRDGHQAWVNGEPTPFLPGATVHTLRLLPTG